MRFAPPVISPLANPRWNSTPDNWEPVSMKDFSGGLCTSSPESNIRDDQFCILSNWYLKDDNSIECRGPYRPYLVTAQETVLATAPLSFRWMELGATDYLIAHIDTKVQYWNSTTWTDIATGLTSGYKAQFVKFSINEAEDCIFCNGKDTPQRWTGSSTSSDLGLSAPDDPSSLAIAETATADKKGIQYNASYYYKFTAFYDSSGTNTKYGESGPSGASSAMAVTGADVSADTTVSAELTNCSAIPTGATKNYVYRSPPDESNGPYEYVGYYSSGTTYTDKTPVGEEADEVPADAGTPPKLKNILSFKNRIWGVGLTAAGALTNKGIYSAEGQPDMIPALNYMYFPDPLIGPVAFDKHVYWFTEKEIYITPDGDPVTYPQPLKICNIGSTSFLSIVDVGNGLVFQSDNNIYWVDFNSYNEKDGDFPFPVGDPIKNKIEDIPTAQRYKSVGTFYKDRYYLSYPGRNQTANTGTVVWDVAAGITQLKQGLTGRWTSLDWAANDLQSFDGTLYSADNGNKYIMEHDFAGGADYHTKTEYGASTDHDIITELKTKRYMFTQNPILLRAMLIQAAASGASYNAVFSFDDGSFEKTKTYVLGSDTLATDSTWLVWGEGTWGDFNWGEDTQVSRATLHKIPSGGKGADVQLTLSCSNSQDVNITEITLFYKLLPMRLGS